MDLSNYLTMLNSINDPNISIYAIIGSGNSSTKILFKYKRAETLNRLQMF